MPVSIWATMMFSPLIWRDSPSSCDQMPPGADSPSMSGVRVVSRCRSSDGVTETTSAELIN